MDNQADTIEVTVDLHLTDLIDKGLVDYDLISELCNVRSPEGLIAMAERNGWPYEIIYTKQNG